MPHRKVALTVRSYWRGLSKLPSLSFISLLPLFSVYLTASPFQHLITPFPTKLKVKVWPWAPLSAPHELIKKLVFYECKKQTTDNKDKDVLKDKTENDKNTQFM